MSLILSGSDGLSDVDGSASTPAIRGTDANTGIFFPAADTTAVATGGTERMRIDSSGVVDIGGTSGGSVGERLVVEGANSAGHRSARINNTSTTNGYSTLWLGSSNDGILRGGSTASAFTDQLAMLTSGAIPLSFYTNNTERMRIDSSGNVGIGTTSIGYNLTVSGRGGFTGGQNVGTMLTGTGSLGGIELLSAGSTNAAFMSFHRPGAFAGYFGLDTDNSFAVGGWSYGAALGSFKCGTLSKTSGSFKIDHPLPALTDTHHLVHSFIEGPQADNLYRGKVQLVNGRAEVNLDSASRMTEGTFVALNRDIQCFTSNESGWDAVRGSVNGNILTIECQNNASTDTVSWLVIGERQDKVMYDAEWTDDNGKVITEPLKQKAAEAK